MNILIIGKFYTEGFAQHIAETLTEMGHLVYRFEHGARFEQANSVWQYRWQQAKFFLHELYSKLPNYLENETKALVRVVQKASPDLILSCHDFLAPVQVSVIKKYKKAPIAMWYPDHIGQFRKAMFLTADYDALFFKDNYIVKVLTYELGLQNVHYLPECCNPRYHKPIELSKEEEAFYGCEVTTAGNLHSNRVALFTHLTEFDCKIWGNPAPIWLNTAKIENMVQNKFVANEEKSKAFRAAKVIVNNIQPGEIEGTNVRTFEVAAAGGFQLVNDRPALSELFEIGKQIETFKSVEELKDKIRYFIAHPTERKAIAEAGAARVTKEHTYKHRLEKIFSTLGL